MPLVAREAAAQPDGVRANQSADRVPFRLGNLAPNNPALRPQPHSQTRQLMQDRGELGEIRRLRHAIKVNICGSASVHARKKCKTKRKGC
jgi:hypothetical protein